jgi:AcrR family transcriptional regulator
MVPSVLQPTAPLDIGVQSQCQRIIDAMVESCAEKTYAATTISDIVARARISRTTFYKHFTDKRDCFGAALDFSLEELRTVALAAHSASDTPPQAVHKASAAILAAMAAKPGLAQLLTGDGVTVDPAVVERYRRLVIPALEVLWIAAGERPRAHTDPGLAFGRAQVLIFNQIAAGRSASLPELLPEIVYLAVAPFAGHEAALAQSRLARREVHLEGPDDGAG